MIDLGGLGVLLLQPKPLISEPILSHLAIIHYQCRPSMSLADGERPDLYDSSRLYPKCPSVPLHNRIARSMAGIYRLLLLRAVPMEGDLSRHC